MTTQRCSRKLIYQDNNYSIDTQGNVINERNNKPITWSVSEQGYARVFLHSKGIRKCYNVHRLVAESFIPKTIELNVVNHIDGNKLNNSVSNLEWVTNKENLEHAHKTGLVNNKGEKHPNSKLTWEEVRDIRLRASEGEMQKNLMREYGCSRATISQIVNNKSWGGGKQK